MADVILHEFGHQAVDRASRRSQALQDVGALLVLVQATQGAFQLPDDLFRPVYQI